MKIHSTVVFHVLNIVPQQNFVWENPETKAFWYQNQEILIDEPFDSSMDSQKWMEVNKVKHTYMLLF